MKLRITCLTLVLATVLIGMVAAQGQRDPRAFGVVPSQTQEARRWAILVGVNDYNLKSIPNLRYCVNDVTALRDELLKHGYDKERMFCLTSHSEAGPDFHPTRANIGRIMLQVFRQVQEGDQLLIVLSGHGTMINDKSAFCPEDADPDQYGKTMFSIEKLYELMNQTKATNKLLIVDACRNVSTKSIGHTPIEKLPAPPPGIVLLSSCNEKEFSYEDGKLGHGVFTHFVIEGIRGNADMNGDGRISLMELTTYVIDETKPYVKDKFGNDQTPYFTGNTTNFIIATTEAKPGAGGTQTDPSLPLPDAVSITEEINRRGVGNASVYGPLTALTVYGNAQLKDKLSAAYNFYRRADEFDKSAAKKRLDDVRAEIEAERAEIAQKTFFGVFTFTTGNVSVYGDESSFTLTIPTRFPCKGSDQFGAKKIEIIFPMSDITGEITTGRYFNPMDPATTLSVNGKTDSIRELVRNSNNYRAKVWFKNLRSDNDVQTVTGFPDFGHNNADVLKIEIIDIRQNLPPSRRIQQRR